MSKTARQRTVCLVVLLVLQASAQTPPYRVRTLSAGITWDGPSTAPFSTRQEQSGWWLVSPQGKPFFSLGVCVVTQGVPRGSFDPNNPGSGQRQRLIRLLRESYQDDWARLLRDFEPDQVGNWGELQKGGMLYLRGGSEGIRVMRQFLGLMAERYYQLVHEAIRRYDRRALILGDRYQSFYYPQVARAAAPWVDVVSTNLNASWNDGTYLRCYLDTLHQLSGKPILASEIYMAARENRSGSRNSKGVFPVVASQPERAAALRTTLVALARTPYILGADWKGTLTLRE